MDNNELSTEEQKIMTLKIDKATFWIKAATFFLAITAFFGGINMRYMSNVAEDTTQIRNTVNQTHLGMQLNRKDIKNNSQRIAQNGTKLNTIYTEFNSHKVTDAEYRLTK